MRLDPITRHDLEQSQPPDIAPVIIERVRQADVKGLGGGCFPTAAKLSRGHNSAALIVNGLQSEPDNSSDIALLREQTATVLMGAALAALACQTSKIVLALPAGIDQDLMGETHKTLESELEWLNAIGETTTTARQVYLPADHASGEEHQLAHRLGLISELGASNRTTPLVDLGLLCLNLATCYAIGRAVYHGEVLDKRMLCINDQAQWVEFDTPVEDLVDPAWINGRHGGYAGTGELVTAGVFCLTPPPALADAPCINCGACAPVCPVSLAPDELYRSIELGTTPAPELKLQDCIECGACNAACPSGLWLAQAFRQAKERETDATKTAAMASKAKLRVEARTARIQAEEQRRTERLRNRSVRQTRQW